jgi:hypothetical protein
MLQLRKCWLPERRQEKRAYINGGHCAPRQMCCIARNVTTVLSGTRYSQYIGTLLSTYTLSVKNTHC